MSKSVLELASEFDSITELVNYLDSHQEASKVVDADPQFWPQALKHFVHDFHLHNLVLARGDLETSEDWKVLALDMSRGNAYMYSWYLDSALGLSYFCPTFGVTQIAKSAEPTDVIIVGTLPRPETKTICVQIWYPTGLTTEKATFICGLSHEDCVRRAFKWLFSNVRHLDRFTSVEFQTEIQLEPHAQDTFVSDVLENDKHLDSITKYNFVGEDASRKSHEVNFILSAVMAFPKY